MQQNDRYVETLKVLILTGSLMLIAIAYALTALTHAA
jgi:hypothetical protein